MPKVSQLEVTTAGPERTVVRLSGQSLKLFKPEEFEFLLTEKAAAQSLFKNCCQKTLTSISSNLTHEKGWYIYKGVVAITT